jgi:hypothetical protein
MVDVTAEHLYWALLEVDEILIEPELSFTLPPLSGI